MAEPFDIDDAVRARVEAAGEAPVFTFRGETFTLPPLGDVGWQPIRLMDSDVELGLSQLLDGQSGAFWELQPTLVEVVELKDYVLQTYSGLLAGERRASSGTSKRTSPRSRRPSKSATTSS